MDKPKFNKTIYILDDDAIFESLEQVLAEGFDDGEEIAIYELKSVKKIKTKVELF